MDILQHTEFPDWPLSLFLADLDRYPLSGSADLVSQVQDCYQRGRSYREFFFCSRGFNRPGPLTIDQERLWLLIDHPAMIFHFESYLVSLIDKQWSEDDRYIISYLQALSKLDVNEWDAVMDNIGACCFEYFAKHPYLYCDLLKDDDRKRVDNMSDQQILTMIGMTLIARPLPGHCSRSDDRPALLQLAFHKIKLIDV